MATSSSINILRDLDEDLKVLYDNSYEGIPVTYDELTTVGGLFKDIKTAYPVSEVETRVIKVIANDPRAQNAVILGNFHVFHHVVHDIILGRGTEIRAVSGYNAYPVATTNLVTKETNAAFLIVRNLGFEAVMNNGLGNKLWRAAYVVSQLVYPALRAVLSDAKIQASLHAHETLHTRRQEAKALVGKYIANEIGDLTLSLFLENEDRNDVIADIRTQVKHQQDTITFTFRLVVVLIVLLGLLVLGQVVSAIFTNDQQTTPNNTGGFIDGLQDVVLRTISNNF